MPGSMIHGGVVKLSFDGSDMSPDDAAAVTSCVVEQRLNLPAACTVMINPVDYDEQSYRAMDFGDFDLGVSMSVMMGMDEPVQLFSGKVSALEPNLTNTCREMEITGYDALFDLDFGGKARTFENSTDSQMASQVIEEAGYEPQASATEAVYPYVLQNNVSDYRFLLSRARRLSYELLANGRRVIFRPSQAGEDPVASLEYGVSLTEFRARARALKKGSSVTRLGWDPKTKQVISATVDSGPPSDRMDGEETGYAASDSFGSSAIVGPDASITDNQIAQSLAQGLYEAGLDDFLEGVAECPGNPAVIAGVNVELSNIGERFNGLYYVVAARHIYDITGGYRTRFEVRRTGI